MPRLLVLVGGLILTVGGLSAATAKKYPETKRVEQVDDYHGTSVADPYRWLEDDVRTSKEVANWVEAQNKVTLAYLESLPEREPLKRRLTELWNYPRYSMPFKVGGRYFYSKNDGLQNQSVFYTLEKLDGEPRVLLDPNSWSKDGTVALAGMAFTDDAKYLAYAKSEAGSDWSHWHVLDVITGKEHADEIKWVKFGGAAWTHDNLGFFYSRFPEPEPGQKFQGLSLNQKLYYHMLGTPQSADVLVYEQPDQPRWTVNGSVTDDGKYLVISIGDGTTSRKSRVLYKDLSQPDSKPRPLIEDFASKNFFIDNVGSVFYFVTDRKAPRSRIVAIDLRQPQEANWKEIIPAAADNLLGANLVGGQLFATYLKDAKTQVKVFDPSGKFLREIQLPGICSASGFGGKQIDQETFYSVSSFATPASIYRLDIATGKSTLFRQSEVKFNPDDYAVKQVFYTSKDGTRVPMFLSHRKGLKLDGTNPTLLYGYGGFNIPMTPGFSVSRLVWMEMGGVLAVANLRGGGEYGELWHRAGTKLQKQNVFDDFIAAAEYLISEKYTQPAKLAIQGGSNGGLLVGACMTQRPELFAACLPAVGVMDMLRYHRFTAGRFWVDDYGSADNPEEFKALLAYSPYHNLKKGTKYPATLVTTADTDDRVVPGHSFKFAAMLQECHAGEAPVLIRIETKAGHGAGKPTAKQIEEIADEWAFLFKNLGVKLPTQ
jgi:prolyl oligopeptidase